jgi:zinc protease
VEATLLAELERLGNQPPTDAEMEKARTQIHASFAYAWDSVTGIGGVVGSAEAVEGYRRLLTFLDRIDAVTAADVQRVAARYFRESSRTIGRFIPTRA